MWLIGNLVSLMSEGTLSEYECLVSIWRTLIFGQDRFQHSCSSHSVSDGFRWTLNPGYNCKSMWAWS